MGTKYQCLAYQPPSSLLCLRVNTVPLYWLANKGIVAPLLEKAGAPPMGPRAEVGERAQLQDTRIGEGSVISTKTSLNQVLVGQGCKVEEKVRISNCIIMDNVTVATGSVLQVPKSQNNMAHFLKAYVLILFFLRAGLHH